MIAGCILLGCIATAPASASSEAVQPAKQVKNPLVVGVPGKLIPKSTPTPSASVTPGASATPAPSVSPTPSASPAATPTPAAIKTAAEDESLWYSAKNPMKKEHQKLLWDYCKKRGVDYIDMLALIDLESNFEENCSTKKYKGYFQISTSHGPNLSKTLNTLNKPLDGAININWGTAMYSWILADKRVKNLKDKQKRDAALSIYHRGSGGYDKYGLDKSYLKKYYKKRDIICSWFEKTK